MSRVFALKRTLFYIRVPSCVRDSFGKMLGSCDINGLSSHHGSNGVHTSAKKITVAVEGNIGCGKTTLLKYFKQSPKVQVVEEPVKKWQNIGNSNALDLMYQDPKRWSYMFESYVLLTMMQVHHQVQSRPVQLIERSAYSACFCFMENLHINKVLSDVEHTVFKEWFDYLMTHQKPQVDVIVYLRTSPQTCMERIKQRSRTEESTVSMELLQSLDDRYEEWLMKKNKFYVPAPVVVIDGDRSLEEMFKFYETKGQDLFRTPEKENIL